MISDHATEKNNLSTDPRQNGQGRLDAEPHKPEKFMKGDAEKGKEWPAKPGGAKPNTAMYRSLPGMVDKSEDC